LGQDSVKNWSTLSNFKSLASSKEHITHKTEWSIIRDWKLGDKDRKTDDNSFALNVELDDVFILKNVVAVDHLALVFGFAPDAGILQLPGKIHMNGPGHIQDR